ncbi:stage V sporulation protein D [Selenomonas sp. TAMA-11512]|uniref:penicillin-binding protein n=1 Tax=Selenomonas sp. TAMA-11512 TaxID=3095337 RepID=UPI0030863B57|nr:stage V sporulation protein D [Selenomonas sp. TAMA-11512]
MRYQEPRKHKVDPERVKNRRRKVRDNLQLLVVFILLGFVLTLIRYGWIQLVQGDEMEARVRMQAEEEWTLQSPRGAILDRNGRELAVSTMTKSLFVDPNHVRDAELLASRLAPLIGLTEQEILEDIRVGGGFVWVKRRMEPDETKAVKRMIDENEYWDCLGFRDEAKRYYPNDMLAANVLGFVGTDDKGLDGVEQQFDSLIKGVAEESAVMTDVGSRPILESLFHRQKYTGDECKVVRLTLDSNIQFILEQEMDKAMAEHAPQHALAIVMNPKTGEILGMGMRPSYNPNAFAKYPNHTWKNIAVSTIYEPGSTFKAVVASAALAEGLVTPNQTYVDPGYVMVSGRKIQNWNGESNGTVTFTDIVKNSLNTGFAQVGLRLGAELLTKYAKLFGFGELTGIELPGEESGLLFKPQDMYDSDIATMAIGQSIAVTPIQLITAMAAIANDGVLLRPHIIKSIQNADGSVYMESRRDEVRQAIDAVTDKTVIGLLEQVVTTGGGQKAQVKGYRIAGKTGTAEKIRQDGVGYMNGHYIASFCGFAPVEDPQVVVLVVIDDPSGLFYGGQVAAPIASSIFSQVLRYMEVEPSSDAFAETELQNAKPLPIPPKPRMPTNVPEGKVVMPDLTGLTIREAADKLAEISITLEVKGSGKATYQSVPPYSIVDPGSAVAVEFTP